MARQYWLMKSEPDQFSIADLARVRVEPWSGVRNYMARANMRRMQVDDGVLFHHSSVDPPGVAGLARVVRTGVVDETQFDPESKYFDERATRDKPVWDCVDVEYVETFPHFVAMERLRGDPALAAMVVLQRGMRLSVQPVTEAEYLRVIELGHTAPSAALPKPATGVARIAKPAAGKRSAAKRPAAKRVAAKPATKRPAAKRVAKPTRARRSKATPR